MKTYAYWASIMLAFLFVSCAKTAPDDLMNNPDTVFPDASNLIVLVRKGSSITAQEWQSKEDGSLEPSERTPNFSGILNPIMLSLKEESIAFFQTDTFCDGEVILYDVHKNMETSSFVFDETGNCNWELTAMTHTESELFLAYILEMEGKDKAFFLRRVPFNSETPEFVDIPLTKKAIGLEPVGNKLFVLDFDEDITEENGLVVIDLEQNKKTYEMNLGYDVGNIFKDTNDNIVIAYPELHTLVNSATLAMTYTQYEEGTAPDFYDSKISLFDSSGNMFYLRNYDGGETENIPGVYDFDNNLGTLYYFQNFLTQEQLEMELNINKAMSLAFDNKEQILYIGYQKKDDTSKGGILQLKLYPELVYLANSNLDGLPEAICIQ
jgi:hypothetical protein